MIDKKANTARSGRIDIITMGCSKNLVDSGRLIRQLEAKGWRCTHDSHRPTADTVVINTCGFIGDAKEESINEILAHSARKEQGKISRLYVMGCLSERYKEELEKEIPQVDKYYGKFDIAKLVDDLGRSPIEHRRIVPTKLTPSHYAYVKISEGCDRHCAYCAIPLITGRHHSRTQEDILVEIKQLVRHGVKEFQIIAQELTYYGVDLNGHRQIAELIDRMADIEGVEWIRLHYAYPNEFPLELLDVMRNRPNVCKYLDIALQHISDNMLQRMHRHVTKQQTLDLIKAIRERVPNICLRTTLMVGFPGETESDFDELMNFVREARFERMGAFAYSEEEGTYSARHYVDDVAEELKQRRLDRLMRLQQNISEELTAQMIGRRLRVIIDRMEGDYYIGRSEYSSPEVDPEVLIHTNKPLTIGQFYDVDITSADEFDLYSEM